MPLEQREGEEGGAVGGAVLLLDVDEELGVEVELLGGAAPGVVDGGERVGFEEVFVE